MRRTPTIESRYSLYQIGWLNPESERTTEINFCRVWDSNSQSLDRQDSVLPLDYQRSLSVTYVVYLQRSAIASKTCTITISLPTDHLQLNHPSPSPPLLEIAKLLEITPILSKLLPASKLKQAIPLLPLLEACVVQLLGHWPLVQRVRCSIPRSPSTFRD